MTNTKIALKHIFYVYAVDNNFIALTELIIFLLKFYMLVLTGNREYFFSQVCFYTIINDFQSFEIGIHAFNFFLFKLSERNSLSETFSMLES